MTSIAFVTGGSGFVGQRLIARLVAAGETVRALARSESAAAAVSKAGATPVTGDLDDVAALTAGMSGAETVYHAAAHVADWGTRADFLRINVGGTENILTAARAAGVRRVVHVSTEAVLVGGAPIVNADEHTPRPRHPIGLYPLTKGLAEDRVLAANRDGLSTVIIRPRFIWGAGDTSLLPKIVAMVRAGKLAWIGGGRHLTSTCHVANVCEGAMLAAARGTPGGIYFLTDGPPVEMREFLGALIATQGVTPPEKSVPRWLAGAGAVVAEGWWRLWGLHSAPPVTRTAVMLVGQEVTVNDARARRELGYVGEVSRAVGLAELAGRE